MDLIKAEIETLKKDYDRIDARLALMESWIQFTSASVTTESASAAQTEEQPSQQEMPGEIIDLPVDPALCLNTSQLGSFHSWSINDEIADL